MIWIAISNVKHAFKNWQVSALVVYAARYEKQNKKLSDSGRSADINCNHKYDFRKFYFTNWVVNYARCSVSLKVCCHYSSVTEGHLKLHRYESHKVHNFLLVFRCNYVNSVFSHSALLNVREKEYY